MRRVATAIAAVATVSSSAAAQTASQAPDPILVSGARADVLVLAPIARDSATDEARLARLFSSCRVGMPVAARDSVAFVTQGPGPLPLDVWQVRDAIVLSVVPRQPRFVDCGDPRAQATVAAARGLRVTLASSYAGDHDVRSVVVRRGERVLQPLVEQRLPVHRLGAAGLVAPGQGWVRVAFDRSAFAPGPDGTVDDLSVEVITASGAAERVRLPWLAVRVAWESSLPARPVLGAEGDADRVATQAAARFFADDASPAARRDARAQAGVALLALGDTASARVVLGALVASEPCFTFAPDAPAAVRGTMTALRRPPARCTAMTPLRTGVRAALLPGFARPRSGGRLDERVLVALGSAGLGLLAVRYHVVARERYDEYLAFQARPVFPDEVNAEVERLFGRAESARHASVAWGTVSASIWIAQGLLALRSERAHARHLDEVSAVRVAPRALGLAPSVVPRVTPSGVGLTLSFTW